MSDAKLLGPDGKPVPQTLTVEYGGFKYPYRIVNQEVFATAKVDPIVGFMASLVQMGDQNNLVWLGMMALAKDMYSRFPDGSQEFLQLTEQLNLNIVDIERNSTSISEELKKLV
jgi:hypothetical protein